MTLGDFLGELSSVSLPNVFNPYRDTCPISDHFMSPVLRRQNLQIFLEAVMRSDVRSIWLGRDLGYRGGRRTGIALTDEFHLERLRNKLGVSGIVKATRDSSVMKERTATHVWRLLGNLTQPVLLWNVFPFHPFENGSPLSNRRHTIKEFRACEHILTTLLTWLRPTTVVALGADAEAALERIGYQCFRVRHPSYGGQADFATGIASIYSKRQLRSCSAPQHTD